MPQITIQKRNSLIKKFNLELIEVFDTNKKEEYKDVVLVCDLKDETKKTLRVGEHRTKGFCYRGYVGKYLVIPKIYKIETQKGKEYELEEYLYGKMFYEYLKGPGAKKIMSDKQMEILIRSWGEFQKIAKNSKLPKYNVFDKKIKKHLSFAIKLVKDKKRLQSVMALPNVQEFFKDNNYPAKWKFSVDNLIVMPDKKIGFIDLAKVGRRFWGYDLGWTFWSAWFHWNISEYSKAKVHMKCLEKYFLMIKKILPREKNIDIVYAGYLIILERIIGGLFDIEAKTGHAQKIYNDKNKKQAFVRFLNELLELTLDKIEGYN